MGMQDYTHTHKDPCNSSVSLQQLLSVDKQAGKIYLFTGEGLRVSFCRSNRNPSGEPCCMWKDISVSSPF